MALTRKKARQILHDGTAQGHSLTAAQRGFFGARASGEPVRPAEVDGIKAMLMKKPKKRRV